MVMLRKPGSKAYREQQRARLVRLGVSGRQAIEQLVADLMCCRYRPREAWRLACELTQDEVAARFNQIRGDPNSRMRGSRICEYEKWPRGGIRPPVRALKILATIYGTTWDRLVDIDDLDAMPVGELQAFLDLIDLRYGDFLDSLAPRPRTRRQSDSHNDDTWQASQSLVEKELVTVPTARPLSERSGGGLPREITHFTGRDGPMAELRARITEQTPEGTSATVYAIDGMAGVGKTAFARYAAQELAKSFPDGAIWVDLYGHTPAWCRGSLPVR
jgi:transcriptional regulator with XRE-family HTH domain